MAVFDWGAMLHVGVVQLKMPVRAFWDLTPAELMLLVSPAQASGSMRRSGFETLLAQFPDEMGERNE